MRILARPIYAWLREMWEEGKASGKPTLVDFDTLREQAREDLVATQMKGR